MNGSRPPTRKEHHGGTNAAISVRTRAESFDDEIMCPIRFLNRPKGHAVGSTRLGICLAEGGADPSNH